MLDILKSGCFSRFLGYPLKEIAVIMKEYFGRTSLD
jgi:hypothetical protein